MTWGRRKDLKIINEQDLEQLREFSFINIGPTHWGEGDQLAEEAYNSLKYESKRVAGEMFLHRLKVYS